MHAAQRPDRRWCWVLAWLACNLASTAIGDASDDTTPAPTAKEIARLLQEKPISADTWPFWRERYRLWYYDRTGATEESDKQLAQYIGQQYQVQEKSLPAPLADDPVAWQLLGRFFVDDESQAVIERMLLAEAAYRRSIELDPQFSGSHSSLAAALVYLTMSSEGMMAGADKEKRLQEAEREMKQCAQLSAEFRPAWLQGGIAFARGEYAEAERLLRRATEDYPRSEGTAVWYLRSVFAARRDFKWSTVSGPVADRLSDKGSVMAMHAVALAHDGQLAEAGRALDRARELGTDPQTVLGADGVQQLARLTELATPTVEQALAALEAKRFIEAERLFRQALDQRPDHAELADYLATALVARQQPDCSGGRVADEIAELCRRFPNNGELETLHAVALAREKRFAESVTALAKAKELGVNPADQIGDRTVQQIREMSRPSLIMRFLKIMGWFGAAYGLIMLLMAGAGVALSALTPRVPVPPPGLAFTHGEVYVSERESMLARMYMCVLVIGLILFYVSVPFVAAGLVVITGALLYLVLMLPRIPIQLLLVVVVTGLGMAWAVLKSAFASGRGEHFGIRKTEQDCPRLLATIRDVAARTETTPMDDVYLAPGAAIGVQQEGRGPFGLFGVKRRVLTVGWATMSSLSVGELKAILAHEYAHFSHRDTSFGRFVHQVMLSMAHALFGMASVGGKLNYVNPFYWFFWLYYHAYNLLAAGFSRSREFLADRMAVSLYGKDAFISSLANVSVEGALFEGSIYTHVATLLAQNRVFENMYAAFRKFCEEQITEEQRHQMYQSLLDEKPSRFATHPTLQERFRAVAPFPDVPPQETQSAVELFENQEEIERELTAYLTMHVAMAQGMGVPADASGSEEPDED